MRLRALRKLEEFEIRKEHDALSEEKAGLEALLGSDEAQWTHIAGEIRDTRDRFGKKTALGARRTQFADAPDIEIDLSEAFIEKEPVTVVCSEKGWIRAMKGHLQDTGSLSYKDGDKAGFVFHAETTSKVLLLSSSGKFFTLDVNKLPGGRGHGEPVRLMADMDAADAIVALFVHQPGARLLLASTEGNGFLVSEDDCVANTRKGKQVLNVKLPAEAHVCRRIASEDDHVACIGENRKLLVFPLSELPEMSRGKGVRLQKYKDGNLS
jgi:topoisomerase-4 subunit A